MGLEQPGEAGYAVLQQEMSNTDVRRTTHDALRTARVAGPTGGGCGGTVQGPRVCNGGTLYPMPDDTGQEPVQDSYLTK